MIIGYGEGNREVELDADDLRTSVQGIGAPRTGKSKLIEHIARQLTLDLKGFCLIDPHWQLYHDFLAWLSWVAPEGQPVVILDTSDPRIGYNPFRGEYSDPARLMTKVDAMVTATLRVWGARDSHEFATINAILSDLYYIALEQNIPIPKMFMFLRHSGTAERAAILERTGPEVRDNMEELYAKSKREFDSQILGIRNRFRMFRHPQVQKLMAMPSVDIPTLIEQNAIFLVCCQQSDVISTEANNIIGKFLINEIGNHYLSRRSKRDYYVIVDECQRFVTHDMEDIVTETPKNGLHMFFFHHRDAQRGTNISEVLEGARIKIRFPKETDRVFSLERPKKPLVELRTPDVEAKPDFKIRRFIDQHMPRIPEADPVELELMPLNPIRYSTDPAELLEAFRYLTAAQLAWLVNDTSTDFQNSRKAMQKVKYDEERVSEKVDGKSVWRKVYCFPEKGREHKNLKHELGITAVHLKLYAAGILAEWQQSGLREYQNPDAFFQTTDGNSFFLEYQQGNPSESLADRARRYDEMKLRGGYEDLCDNFRVLFVVQTRQKAENLCRIFAAFPSPCRFWSSDTTLEALCAKHQRHTIGVPDAAP